MLSSAEGAPAPAPPPAPVSAPSASSSSSAGGGWQSQRNVRGADSTGKAGLVNKSLSVSTWKWRWLTLDQLVAWHDVRLEWPPHDSYHATTLPRCTRHNVRAEAVEPQAQVLAPTHARKLEAKDQHIWAEDLGKAFIDVPAAATSVVRSKRRGKKRLQSYKHNREWQIMSGLMFASTACGGGPASDFASPSLSPRGLGGKSSRKRVSTGLALAKLNAAGLNS